MTEDLCVVTDGSFVWDEARVARQMFTVTDLKQFAYCPRVVYYTYCLPLLRPETYKMRESVMAHEEEIGREERRSLRPYGLTQGRRCYDVLLYAVELGLSGRVDMVVDTGTELIPIDYKMTERRAGTHFRLQLTAYGMMLEEMLRDVGPNVVGLAWRPIARGFLYSMITRQAEEVHFTPPLRAKVRRIVGDMRQMVERERMPPTPTGRGRCMACEFRRFCNDL